MHGPLNVKFVNAKQAKETYHYRNTKEKLYKTNAEMWHNKIFGEKQLAPNCISISSIPIPLASSQHNLYNIHLFLCVQY
jgi:hypothetical protein